MTTHDHAVAAALADLGADTLTEQDMLPAYLTEYLPSHAGASDWTLITESKRLLDHLSVPSIHAEVARLGFWSDIPTHLLATIWNAPTLQNTPPQRRRFLRNVAQSRLFGPQSGSSVLWALPPSSFSVPLTGHTGPVTGVCPVTLPDGTTLIATTSDDKTVRFWDPVGRCEVARRVISPSVPFGCVSVDEGVAVACSDGVVVLRLPMEQEGIDVRTR